MDTTVTIQTEPPTADAAENLRGTFIKKRKRKEWVLQIAFVAVVVYFLVMFGRMLYLKGYNDGLQYTIDLFGK